MATPSYVEFTPGDGGKTATYLVNESGHDKHFQRMVQNTPDGEDCSVGSFITLDFSIQRPNNTTPYAVNDVWAATSAAVGGSDLANATRGAGKGGLITDMQVFCSAAPSTLLEGELFLFDQAVSEVPDNAPFALNFTDLRKLAARIPFALEVAASGVSFSQETGLNRAFTTVGSASLKGLVKVKNAYTPSANETLAFRLNCMRTN